MGPIPRLFEIYKRHGFQPVSGLNPAQWHGMPLAPFTHLLKGGRDHTPDLGISLHELTFFATLFGEFRPKSVFIVGNAFGWSSVAISLMLPGVRVVALDAADNDLTREGLALTNQIAAEEGLDLLAVAGYSPQAVPEAVARLPAPPDLLFVDGLHTNAQVVLDFEALNRVAAADALYLFHDVHQFNLYEGLDRIVTASGYLFRRLLATPSGIGAVYPASMEPVVGPALSAFSFDDASLAIVERIAVRYAERQSRLKRLRRSFAKRANWLRERMGQTQA